MSILQSPSIVTDDLLIHYDMSNLKSFVGSPMTNLVTGGDVNGFPTIGNGWETYNTNNYNGGAYYSIGTIVSIVGNLVTTSIPHNFKTFNVMNPQTTGGGVTAGSDYFVKAWSTTTFTLHAYNGSQDGSQGIAVLNSLLSDTRVAVNATSFPTMWYGFLHQPNSGLVKEIIPNGFNFKGRKHDCLRMHYITSEFTDGMAYGIYPSWVAGNNYTVSFYHRAASPNAIGNQIQFQRWTNGDQNVINFTLGKNWQKFTATFANVQTAGTNFYWFSATGGVPYSWDISEIASFIGNQPSEYTSSATPRTSSNCLFDLTKKATTNLVGPNLRYSDNAIIVPNVNDSYIDITNPTTFRMGTQNFSISLWTKLLDAAPSVILETRGADLAGYLWAINYPAAGQMAFFLNMSVSQNTYSSAATTLPNNAIQNLTAVINRSTSTIIFYLNGQLWDTISGIHTSSISPASGDVYRIGYDHGGSTQNFELYDYKHYGIALTASEVKQNFNATRGRYGL